MTKSLFCRRVPALWIQAFPGIPYKHKGLTTHPAVRPLFNLKVLSIRYAIKEITRAENVKLLPMPHPGYTMTLCLQMAIIKEWAAS